MTSPYTQRLQKNYLTDAMMAADIKFRGNELSSMVEQAKVKTIYTTHEVSRLLQVNPRSVINWIDQNLLPSYRTPGGHRRIRRDDLLAFLRKHQIPTPAALVE